MRGFSSYGIWRANLFFFMPTKLLDLYDHVFNLEYISHDIHKEEIKFESVRLWTFVPATCDKNELINLSPFHLLKNAIIPIILSNLSLELSYLI